MPPSRMVITGNEDQGDYLSVNAFGRTVLIDVPKGLRKPVMELIGVMDPSLNRFVYKVFGGDTLDTVSSLELILGVDESKKIYIPLEQDITPSMREAFRRLMDSTQIDELRREGRLHPKIIEFVLLFMKAQAPQLLTLLPAEKLRRLFADWMTRQEKVNKGDDNADDTEGQTREMRTSPALEQSADAPIGDTQIPDINEAMIRYLVVVYIDKYYSNVSKNPHLALEELERFANAASDFRRKEAYKRTHAYFLDVLTTHMQGVNDTIVNGGGAILKLDLHQRGAVHFAMELFKKNQALQRPTGVFNADQMGMGKTLENLAILLNLPQFNPARANRHVVVLPKSGIGIWMQEIRKWAKEDHPIFIVDGFSGMGTLYESRNQLQGRQVHVSEIENLPAHRQPFILVTFDSLRGQPGRMLNDVNDWLEQRGYSPLKVPPSSFYRHNNIDSWINENIPNQIKEIDRPLFC